MREFRSHLVIVTREEGGLWNVATWDKVTYEVKLRSILISSRSSETS